MYWANFLHFYQPPDQKKAIMDKVVNEGYRPLLSILKKHKKVRLTVNISGCLLEMLDNTAMKDVIEDFRKLVQNGQIELTASVKYHPFLPLMSRYEILRQIKLNNDTLRYYFGDLYKPFGFFSPEAGYCQDLGKLIAKAGYRYILIDEIAYGGKLAFRNYDYSSIPAFHSRQGDLETAMGRQVDSGSKNDGTVDYSKLHKLRGTKDLYVFFRERIISDVLAFHVIKSSDQFFAVLSPEVGRKRYLLTGSDGEAFGHHRPGLENILDEILTRSHDSKLHTVTITDLFKLFPGKLDIAPLESTWGTSEEDIVANIPYGRWNHPKNRIHKMQWKLTNLAIDMVSAARKRGDPGYKEARKLLDEALYSCHFWWAAATPWWSIENIEKGAKNLVDVVGKLTGPERKSKDKREKSKNNYSKHKTNNKKQNLESSDWKSFVAQKRLAKRLYGQIVFSAFDWQRRDLL